MSPTIAAAWTLVLLEAIVLLSTPSTLATFASFLLAILLFHGIRPRQIFLIGRMALPFMLPLLVVHGVLNPEFPISGYLLGHLPFRSGGIAFACVVAARVALGSCVVVIWSEVDREELIGWSQRWLPQPLVFALVVTLATAHVVTNQIQRVYMAQQARGIPVGPGISVRLRALPSLILPVVTNTLNEGTLRAELMGSRGFGAAPLPLTRAAAVGWSDRFSLVAAAVTGVVMIVERLGC